MPSSQDNQRLEALREPLLRNIRRITYSEDEAQDITQDVMLRAMRSIEHFCAAENPMAYLMRIAQNRITDVIRRRRLQEVALEPMHCYIRDNSSGPEQQTVEGELSVKFQECFLRLPIELQQIYGMVVIDGKSYEEVCQVLDIPMTTFKPRLHRARLRMRKMLQQYYED